MEGTILADSGEKHVVIVGAGPGGLTAAMILARRGFRVSVFEEKPYVGGRNSELRVGDYSFDLGPTFLIMRFLLDEVFRDAGRNSEDYLDFVRLEPMYELVHDDFVLRPQTDPEAMRREIARVFPGQEGGFQRLLEAERKRFAVMYPCLQKDYSSLGSLLSPTLLRALPRLSLTKSLYQVISGYFAPERLRISFTFQSKYLGMSPWTCPGAFMIIPYGEYAFGIYHVQGGLCRISEAMARVVEEEGGRIHLGTPVNRIIVEDRTAKGVELSDGTKVEADDVVINADFAHAMANLADPADRRKYTDADLESRPYSCSTFMLYLGLDKIYETAHHTIIFAGDYKRNLDDIATRKVLSEDISFYVRNSSVTDPSVAPEGHSAVYILVPVPNNTSRIDWESEEAAFADLVLETVERRMPMRDLREHIKVRKVIQPAQWEEEYNIYCGATFNLAHTLGQMLYFRPRNRFEEWRHCYLVGGGTHPGSGLPTIYESGRISANLITASYGIPYAAPPPFKG